tara:strand:- start:81 stop:257 length:177 start_codon:yes stop_codon:yes gene_type:complete
MLTQLQQDLKSVQSQLVYTNAALASNLENWERKEFTQVKEMLLAELESLNFRINFLNN